MSTVGKIKSPGSSSMGAAEVCQAVVLAEDPAAHVSAMELCDRLMQQLGDELQFNFHTCRFKEMSEPVSARTAAEAAAHADILLFSMHGDDLPAPVRQWLELCFELRQGNEGALALLLVEPINPAAAVVQLMGRLEQAAGRLRMDFLPLVPQSVAEAIRSLPEPPHAIRPLSRGIHNRPPTDHWGINE